MPSLMQIVPRCWPEDWEVPGWEVWGKTSAGHWQWACDRACSRRGEHVNLLYSGVYVPDAGATGVH